MSKVIIRGHVFDYAEKAPFVVSGKSVLGALEYDDEADKIKCHECGTWVAGLGYHLKAHGMKAKEYRSRHGLNISRSPLAGRKICARKRIRNRISYDLQAARGTGICSAGHTEKLRANAESRRGSKQPRTEHANLVGRCRAQSLFRLQVLAAQLGRTPTTKEINGAGITGRAIQKLFGSINGGIRQAGLIPRTFHGPSVDVGLPPGFPTKKQLDDSRMSWPKEYFGVNGLERRRA